MLIAWESVLLMISKMHLKSISIMAEAEAEVMVVMFEVEYTPGIAVEAAEMLEVVEVLEAAEKFKAAEVLKVVEVLKAVEVLEVVEVLKAVEVLEVVDVLKAAEVLEAGEVYKLEVEEVVFKATTHHIHHVVKQHILVYIA